MGKGASDGSGDAARLRDSNMKKSSFALDKLKMSSVKDDLLVLKSIWFNKVKGDDHAARLENFYKPQAAACELPTPVLLAPSPRAR